MPGDAWLEQAEIFHSVSSGLTPSPPAYIADHQIGRLEIPNSNDGRCPPRLGGGNDGLDIRLVDTGDCRTVKWHAIHNWMNASECHRGAVLVEVFAVDGVTTADDRREACRKLRSLSSASTIKYSPLPSRRSCLPG